MKTVLIATDFSKTSRNASMYGVEFANALNARIILLHAYTVPSPIPGINISISRFDLMAQAKKRLSDEASRFDNVKNIIETICDEGSAKDVILQIANEKKADFIIVGMKGYGIKLDPVFGSTVVSLTKTSNIPLVVIPDGARFITPGKIVFATNEKIEPGNEIPEHLNFLSQKFGSKLFVVKVISEKDEAVISKTGTLKNGMVAKQTNTSFYVAVDKDIRHALNDFIIKQNADMVVMIPHQHDWIERLFRKSQTKEMIFHTKIPVLILPEISSGSFNEVESGLSCLSCLAFVN